MKRGIKNAMGWALAMTLAAGAAAADPLPFGTPVLTGPDTSSVDDLFPVGVVNTDTGSFARATWISGDAQVGGIGIGASFFDSYSQLQAGAQSHGGSNLNCPTGPCTVVTGIASYATAVQAGTLHAATDAATAPASSLNGASYINAYGDAYAGVFTMLHLSQAATVTLGGTLDGLMTSSGTGGATLGLKLNFLDPQSLRLQGGSEDPDWLIDSYGSLELDHYVSGSSTSPGPQSPASQAFSLSVDLPAGDIYVLATLYAGGGAHSLDDSNGSASSDFGNTVHLLLSASDDTPFTVDGGLIPQAGVVPEPSSRSLLALGLGAAFCGARRKGRGLRTAS